MKIRYAIEYGALRALLAVFAAMPAPMASNAGGAIFRTLGPIMGISRVGRRNIGRAFPSWTRDQVDATLREMWDNLGRIIAEYPHLDEIARDYTTFVTPEIYAAAAKRDGATLFVSGHLGNWEILPPAILIQHGLVMHSAYRAPNNPYVDALVVKLRAFDGRLKSFGKTRKGLAEILRALQAGESVGMLIDQKMNTGLETQFFNYPAMTSTAFVELTRKVGCPLVPGRIVRTKGCHFEVDAEAEIPVGDRPTEDIVADMQRVLERWITQNPGQWLWIHRRWKD
jgi:KDO2-lipid IV(A) lauroyltransferase